MGGIWSVVKQGQDNEFWLGAVVLAFKPGTQEAEAGR